MTTLCLCAIESRVCCAAAVKGGWVGEARRLVVNHGLAWCPSWPTAAQHNLQGDTQQTTHVKPPHTVSPASASLSRGGVASKCGRHPRHMHSCRCYAESAPRLTRTRHPPRGITLGVGPSGADVSGRSSSVNRTSGAGAAQSSSRNATSSPMNANSCRSFCAHDACAGFKRKPAECTQRSVEGVRARIR
jgi:hypothetical protein